jgi:orotidine-5'-phosphate decarboxylase
MANLDSLNPAQRIIVAADVSDESELKRLVGVLRDKVGMFKVGKEVFTSLGPKAVEIVLGEGGQVFLDLKYHDIPNTVAGAVRAAGRLGVSMLTVHASGGKAMLEAAVQAAHEREPKLSVIAVTVLTSLALADLTDIGLRGTMESAVDRLSKLALDAGVDGLVSSPQELKMLRSRFGENPVLVTPGVRPSGSEVGDQRRVATPAQAVRDGADYLIIGRPITKAPDPAAAAEAIAKEIGG